MSQTTNHKQLTVRGIDDELASKIDELSKSAGISRNRAVLQLLRRGAGTGHQGHRRRISSALDAFIGSWSDEEADELLASIGACDQIDSGFWK